MPHSAWPSNYGQRGKKNCFSGRILEIEGLRLTVEQAFELSDASAERSAGGCTIKLDEAPIREYLESNITLLKWMIAMATAMRALSLAGLQRCNHGLHSRFDGG